MTSSPEPEALMAVLKDAIEDVLQSFVVDFKETSVESCSEEGEGLVGGPSDSEVVLLDTAVAIAFSGDNAGGVLLRCSAPGAEQIAKSMLMVMDDGEVLEFDEIADALGECANMIAGSVKTKALDPVGSFEMTTPTVIRGEGEMPSDGALTYELSRGHFSAKIWLEQ